MSSYNIQYRYVLWLHFVKTTVSSKDLLGMRVQSVCSIAVSAILRRLDLSLDFVCIR